MTKPRYPHGLPGQVASASGSVVLAGGELARGLRVDRFLQQRQLRLQRPQQQVLRARRALGCRPRECQGATGVTFRSLHQAWQEARARKRHSANQLAWETNAADRLIELEQRLAAGTWRPGQTTCFVATRPKAREIHAPDFGDRVVHHWLVPQLEAVFESGFIHDSYANRKGKGTHAAANRARAFVRQVQAGQGGGWYLQLDIANFFYSIHRPTLWALLKRRLRGRISDAALRATHALVQRSPIAAGVVHLASAAERTAVPAHKRLENAAPGRGLPIGNLSSQFFANAYLDQLDQFVKHELRAKRYLRYVDDFVLVHHDRAQLEAWHAAIARFLRERLRLELKDDVRLKPLTSGLDFLGYVIYPTHTVVRRRVAVHAGEALDQWQRAHVRRKAIVATPARIRALQSTWSSYVGHFSHANSRRLIRSFHARYPWLDRLVARPLKCNPHGEHARIRIARAVTHRE